MTVSKLDKQFGVQLVTITEKNAGQRLDNFLLSQLKGVPKSHVYRILRKGEVRVNKGRKEAKFKLGDGDIVRIPPIRRMEKREITGIPNSLQIQLQKSIIYEDEDLLILNKPSGISVHGGSAMDFGVIEALRKIRPHQTSLELAHRLDKDTSGCLILTKKASVLKKVHEMFRNDSVEKRYLALISGVWPRKKQVVEIALKKNISRGGERIVIASKSGKRAETLFRRLKRYRQSTLVEVQPRTGRTHQIRVHAAWLGHPILGDQRYGQADENKTFRKQGLKRLFLHAETIGFEHPGSGKKLVISSPLSEDLVNFINYLDDEAKT